MYILIERDVCIFVCSDNDEDGNCNSNLLVKMEEIVQ